MPVSLAASVGSERRLSCTSRFSRDSRRSTPAKEVRRLERSLIVVMAGRGLLVRECSESIMQFDRSSEFSLVKEARLSGISVKRLDDKLIERRLFANG